jgi:formate hydrogenlyase subunit 6/NADH:ubiquinone oxidoreductase subunit I
MLKFIKQSIKTGMVTQSLPELREGFSKFKGLPLMEQVMWNPEVFENSVNLCPSDAMTFDDGKEGEPSRFRLLMGRCISCGLCEEAFPELFRLSERQDLSVRDPNDLIRTISPEEKTPVLTYEKDTENVGFKVKNQIQKFFGRSLHIREVDTGSCNACEWEITALTNPFYDIQRFGIDFVASPRFADMLLVTGPVTRSMEEALLKTYEATPDPKWVVAVGACACDGGIFRKTIPP